MTRVFLIILSVWLLVCGLTPQMVTAATRLAVASGGSDSGDCTVTACTPQRSLDQAVADDTVSWAPGTYGNNYNINVTSGSFEHPILVKSATLHGAVLTGGACDNSDGSNQAPYGFGVDRVYWIIEGFDIRNMCVGIRLGWNNIADNTEIRYNIISPFNRWGINMDGASSNVHHNVVAFGYGANCCPDTMAALNVGPSSTGSIVKSNWFYSVGNRRFIEPCCGQHGYTIFFNTSNNSTFQGNVEMDGSKGGLRIFGDTAGTCASNPIPSCTQSSNHMVRDNISAYQQGGPYSAGENAADNTFTNNVTYGSFEYGVPGGKGNPVGRNHFTHNTILLTKYTYQGGGCECGSEVSGVCARESEWRDNLHYSPFTRPNDLLSIASMSGCLASGGVGNNLFWQPGSTDGFVNRYTFQGSDITTGQPVFVDDANGDFRLASGSPGQGTASDGSDRGANFNNDLRYDWLKAVIALPSVEKTVSGSNSVSFTAADGVDSSHYYRVLAYVKESAPFTGQENFTANGVSHSFQMSDALFWVKAAPIRYLYMTTVQASSNTITITWNNTSSFDKILIRQMPTATEAYALMASTPSTSPGVLLHWSLDDATGTTAADSSGNANDGQLSESTTASTQGPAWVSGQFNGAAACDGVNDSIRIPSLPASLQPTTAMSISVWFQPTTGFAYSGANSRYLLDVHGDVDGYTIQFEAGGIKVSLNGVFQDRLLTYTFNIGTWYHIVARWDGTTYKLNINGSLVDSAAMSGSMTYAGGGLNLCRNHAGNNGLWLNGRVDELRITNYGLSDAEVASLFALNTLADVLAPVPPTNLRLVP